MFPGCWRRTSEPSVYPFAAAFLLPVVPPQLRVSVALHHFSLWMSGRLRGLNPPIGCHSQVPSRKGEGEERKKERRKERKKKTVPHSDKKLNKRKMAERGRLGAPVGRARSSLLISLMFYLCICIIPVINSCKVIGWLRVGSQSINLYICESIQLGSLLLLKPCKPQITAYYNS